MGRRAGHNDQTVTPLLDLLERRFAVRLTEGSSVEHLRTVQQHYCEKRALLRARLGEAGALQCPDYAKAFLISEAARLMILREIRPRPKKTKNP